MDTKTRIKNLMKQKGVTEYKLSKLSGLSQSTISNIFNRNTEPTIPTLEAICNGLGISMAQFFFDESSEMFVVLTKEQKAMFDKWLFLTSKQKEFVNSLIESYIHK